MSCGQMHVQTDPHALKEKVRVSANNVAQFTLNLQCQYIVFFVEAIHDKDWHDDWQPLSSKGAHLMEHGLSFGKMCHA
jgi:hypothetical protein